MKKINVLLLALMMTIGSVSVFAQKAIKEGYIKMEITDISSSDESTAAMLNMMKGTQTEVFFNKTSTLTKMSMMGGMVENKTLMNKETKALTMLVDAMGQKISVNSTEEEQNKMKEDQGNPFADAEFVYDKNDTKEILGHKCYKAVLKPKDQATVPLTIEAYVTKDLKIDESLMQGIDAGKMDGVPLEYALKIIQQGVNISMTYTVVALEKKVDKKVFEMSTEGYTEMTMEEFTKNMGGMMGGGMGF